MPEGLRERTRRAVRAELAEVAIDLFARQGFEETTVDEIARAAGLTKRSFFRYFPTKEDAVFDSIDVTGENVVAAIGARPAEEDPWTSLQHVLRHWQEEIHASERTLATHRLIETTPALGGRLHQRRTEWRRRVSDALRDRPGAGLDGFTADLLTNAATAVLDAVSAEWLRSGGTADRVTLLDRGFSLARVRLVELGD
ncbi:TetR family transcriptional regulator [Amycolatopsis keratiniphila]|uniref:TetR family transcriptional regulator n=1 Tax=Amycolatopsis keratiniphila TaxID=129921 RepID=UPI00087B2452|nr:TetR family transcriptional regulator [Amycolatopsis keratiniphila]SDU37303.1 DNA-binding transcriptional regulator, AcrR family [Amycolatopsis keratiniphila]